MDLKADYGKVTSVTICKGKANPFLSFLRHYRENKAQISCGKERLVYSLRTIIHIKQESAPWSLKKQTRRLYVPRILPDVLYILLGRNMENNNIYQKVFEAPLLFFSYAVLVFVTQSK